MSIKGSALDRAYAELTQVNAAPEPEGQPPQFEQPIHEFAMDGQAPGTDGIMNSTADIAHLETVHVGNEVDMDMGL